MCPVTHSCGTMTQTPIRPAATVIVLRDFPDAPRILMGQRGAKAAFMPNKFVFPGGRVDDSDAAIDLMTPLPEACAARLRHRAQDTTPTALAAAAIRELWEETGQILGHPAPWPDAPDDWAGFAAKGFRPHAGGLTFFFRAITPPGRPRRFDARFFLLRAEDLATDPDDFSDATDELSHLSWVSLSQARALDLPFITSVVLGELAGLTEIAPPPSVPFFENTDEESLFHRLQADPVTPTEPTTPR